MDIRPVTRGDISDIHALTRRWESYWNAPLVTPLDEVAEEFDDPHFQPESKTLGYWHSDVMVAYGRVWHRPSLAVQERAYLQGFVDPHFRGRGIGRELLRWQVERGREILLASGTDLPKYLRADEWDWIEESHRMYQRFDLEPVRYFAEMLKPLDAEEFPDPTDFEIIPWDRTLEAEALEAVNTSFADHWGSTPSDLESFLRRLELYGVRLDLSFLAVADREVIGVALNAHYPEDGALLGRRDGWVEVLGVVREWRRKGVATALLKASFAAFAGAGFTHSSIGVDTENPTDAFRLYTEIGYQPNHRSITSELRVE